MDFGTIVQLRASRDSDVPIYIILRSSRDAFLANQSGRLRVPGTTRRRDKEDAVGLQIKMSFVAAIHLQLATPSFRR